MTNKRRVFVKHYTTYQAIPPSHMPSMKAVFKGHHQLIYIFDI